MDKTVWGMLWRDEEETNHNSGIGYSWYNSSIWSVLWWIIPGVGMCINAREKGGRVCFSTVEDPREELSHPWSRTGCGSFCS